MPGTDENNVSALRRSEELYARAFLQSPLPMTLTNAETNRITAANEEFLRLVGFWRSEVIGATSEELDLWPERAARTRIADELSAGEIAGPVRGGVRAKDGTIVPCVVWFRLLKLESGHAVLTALVPAEQVPSQA